MTRTFRNSLCLEQIPESVYSGLSPRYRICQRREKHLGFHLSWSREWNTGDQESRPRSTTKESQQKRAIEARQNITEKKCPRCQNTRPADKFDPDYRQPDGYRQWCRACQKTYLQERSSLYLPKKREHGRRTDRSLRREVLIHYSSAPPVCLCCGEKTLEFLSIDHIDGGGSKHKREVHKIYRWLKKNNFPEGFRVLCHNCNQSRGAYGYCPHEKERDEERISSA